MIHDFFYSFLDFSIFFVPRKYFISILKKMWRNESLRFSCLCCVDCVNCVTLVSASLRQLVSRLKRINEKRWNASFFSFFQTNLFLPKCLSKTNILEMSWTLKGHKKILLKFFGGRDQQASDLLIQLQPLNIWLLLSCGNLKT